MTSSRDGHVASKLDDAKNHISYAKMTRYCNNDRAARKVAQTREEEWLHRPGLHRLHRPGKRNG
jgi:hypothetical protein